MEIAVIGAGYVGLVAAACFANFNMKVVCIDVDKTKIAQLNLNIIPIYEPGLEEIVTRTTKNGTLRFSCDINDMVSAQIIILAVGTPALPSGEADLSYLINAIDSITQICEGNKTLIIKSTVPIGTAKLIKTKLKVMGLHKKFSLISNPEFLREGSSIYDFLHPDRIIVGVDSEAARKIAITLYQPLTSQDVPLLITDNTTAETIKYAANSYLAMRVAYINEIANLCENVGASIDDVATGMGLDPRIGKHYLQAGPGFGGSCFPKDTLAINFLAKKAGVDLSIIDSVIKSNDLRKHQLCKKIIDKFNKHSCKKIAVLGLTFKADTDDMRDSIAFSIVPALIKSGFELKCYDPSHPKTAKKLLNIELQTTLDSCLDDVDAALIITEWAEFKLLEIDKLASMLNKKVIYDLRNIYNKDMLLNSSGDFIYYSIGRPSHA